MKTDLELLKKLEVAKNEMYEACKGAYYAYHNSQSSKEIEESSKKTEIAEKQFKRLRRKIRLLKEKIREGKI